MFSFVTISLIFFTLFYYLNIFSKNRGIIKASHDFIKQFYVFQNHNVKPDKEEIQNLVIEFLEKNFKNINCNKFGDDVPVKLLWKGGTLVESSIHCNVRDESAEPKILCMKKKTKLLVQCGDVGSGDEKSQLSPTSSEECTVSKIAEIRKLLESEPEIKKTHADKDDCIDDVIDINADERTSIRRKNMLKKTSQTCFPPKIGYCRKSICHKTSKDFIDRNVSVQEEVEEVEEAEEEEEKEVW